MAGPASSSTDPAFSTELGLRETLGRPGAELLGRAADRDGAARPQRQRGFADLTLPTSQVFDFEVADRSSSARVWHWSHDRMFATVLTEIVFEAGETEGVSATWDQTGDTGTTVPKGEYAAGGFVNTSGPGLRSAAVPFSIE